ncbi:MAG: hypothetical protein R3Y44_01510 [Rikenellaceae bacterium]
MQLIRVATLTLLMLTIYTSTYGADQPETSAEVESSAMPTRGLVNLTNVFISKGQWGVGGTISYSTHTNDNYKFLVVDNIYSDGYSFKVSPMITYSYANNQAVGARFVYDRSLLRIDSASISFGEGDTSIDLTANDFYSLSHSYTVQAILRQYIPIGQSKIFALFNEVQLGVGGSQSKFALDSPVTGTYSTSKDISLGLAPGVVAFANNRVSVEVSVGVLGLSYKHIEQVHNQVTVGDAKSKSMNFKINIFSIGFGANFYI